MTFVPLYTGKRYDTIFAGGCTVGTMHKRYFGRSRGISLLEIMVVLGIIMVVSGMAFVNLSGAMNDSKVVTGYNTVLMTIRRARETAVSERRIYRVRFDTPGAECDAETHTTGNACVLLIKDDTGDIVYAGALPQGIGFKTFSQFPNNSTYAPDSLVVSGALTGVCFDIGVTATCSNEVYFYPDGSAKDANKFMNSGVVYIARTNDVNSSRAITVLGATGRIRGWKFMKTGATYYWDLR